jgi:hypothetical protein
MRQQHPLFAQYPLDHEFQLDGETVTSPYHIYDGQILLIGGRANAKAAKALLQNESLLPILDHEGNALVALWVCDFTEANLGPHHELQVSIFAAFEPQANIQPHPFAILRLLTVNPQAMMLCHGLWNNTERVVRYNQAHLGLNARLCTSNFDHSIPQQWAFQFADTEEDQALLSGKIQIPPKQSPALLWEMSQHLGLSGMVKFIRTPFVQVPVVNPRSAYATENQIARTYTKSDTQTLFSFDEDQSLTLHAPQYAALQFKPDFVQYNTGVRFVYTRPESVLPSR